MIQIEWAGHAMELFPERALLLRDAETLVIADPHFGKPAAFRSAGIFVPSGTTEADLTRLDRLIERTGCRRLLILGDFFHAKSGRDSATLDALAAWRARWSSFPITLVRGNHDAHAGDPPEAWGIQCVGETAPEGEIAFSHIPRSAARGFVMAGHLHPGVRLGGFGDNLRAACFWAGRRVMTLPAFGSFTGMHLIRPARGDRVFAIGPGEVVEVTRLCVRA